MGFFSQHTTVEYEEDHPDILKQIGATAEAALNISVTVLEFLAIMAKKNGWADDQTLSDLEDQKVAQVTWAKSFLGRD